MRILIGIFLLSADPPSTVPMYADKGGLLVLTAPLTSVSLSKTSFSTDWNPLPLEGIP